MSQHLITFDPVRCSLRARFAEWRGKRAAHFFDTQAQQDVLTLQKRATFCRAFFIHAIGKEMDYTKTDEAKERRAKTVKINFLLRAYIVQKDYQAQKREGIPDAFIWRKYIYPKHLVSRVTFYRYLATNVRQELKRIGIEPDKVLKGL